MKKLIVFTGAGISAESGIKTFRDSDGLWEEYNISDVATVTGWQKNRAQMLEFYNKRRAQLSTVEPNAAHKYLADLEKEFDVQIITQNVDDLHERAGSTKVLHLHGELTKMKSCGDKKIVDWPADFKIETSSIAADGSALRPHIVWFGESVPNMDEAAELIERADIVVVIGTSLQVYPAAGLVDLVYDDIPIYIIDPNNEPVRERNRIFIQQTATEGVKILDEKLTKYK